MPDKPFRSATKVPFAIIDEAEALVLDKLIDQRPEGWLGTLSERVKQDIACHEACGNYIKAGHVRDWMNEVLAWNEASMVKPNPSNHASWSNTRGSASYGGKVYHSLANVYLHGCGTIIAGIPWTWAAKAAKVLNACTTSDEQTTTLREIREKIPDSDWVTP